MRTAFSVKFMKPSKGRKCSYKSVLSKLYQNYDLVWFRNMTQNMNTIIRKIIIYYDIMITNMSDSSIGQKR